MSRPLRDLAPAGTAPVAAGHYVCFPPAGGSAALLRLLAIADPPGRVWGYQYPGRADQFAIPLPPTLEDLAAKAAGELFETLGEQVHSAVLVGFSMGALVALEVSQRLQSTYGVTPAGLVVVGTTAPHRRSTSKRRLPTEADLAGALREVPQTSGSGPSAAEASAEALAYARDLLTADLRLTIEYDGPVVQRAPCPVIALCGADDPRRLGGDATTAWARWSTGPFSAHVVPGPHLGLLSPDRAEEFWGWIQLAADARRRATTS